MRWHQFRYFVYEFYPFHFWIMLIPNIQINQGIILLEFEIPLSKENMSQVLCYILFLFAKTLFWLQPSVVWINTWLGWNVDHSNRWFPIIMIPMAQYKRGAIICFISATKSHQAKTIFSPALNIEHRWRWSLHMKYTHKNITLHMRTTKCRQSLKRHFPPDSG